MNPQVFPKKAVWRPALRAFFVLICLGAAAAVALKPTPQIWILPFMPRKIGLYLDAHDALRNLIGFAMLAGTVHFSLSGFRRAGWRQIGQRVIVLIGFIALLEFVQLFLPARKADFGDVVMGALGVMAASLPWVKWIFKERQKWRSRPQK